MRVPIDRFLSRRVSLISVLFMALPALAPAVGRAAPAGTPPASLVEVLEGASVTFGATAVGEQTFANRDYRMMAIPRELEGKSRLVFAGGEGHQIRLRFRRDTAVIGAFGYNRTASWSFPDKKSPAEHAWQPYLAKGYRGESNARLDGKPHYADVYYRVCPAESELGTLPPWWVCLAVVPAGEVKALLETDRSGDPLVRRVVTVGRLPELVAHRGLLRMAPENTLPALSAALELGFGIEFDVRATSDGELVIIHDATLDRTTTGTGPVSALPFAAVRALDAGRWFGSAFAGTRVPTLAEVLSVARERSLRPTPLAIHVKIGGDAALTRLVQTIRESGVAERCFLFEWGPRDLARVRKIAGGIPVTRPARSAQDFEAGLADPNADHLWIYFVPTRAQMDAAGKAGKQVHVSPLVPGQGEAIYRRLLEAGVTTFCTDYPVEVRATWTRLSGWESD